jgi:hypothetical protein
MEKYHALVRCGPPCCTSTYAVVRAGMLVLASAESPRFRITASTAKPPCTRSGPKSPTSVRTVSSSSQSGESVLSVPTQTRGPERTVDAGSSRASAWAASSIRRASGSGSVSVAAVRDAARSS